MTSSPYWGCTISVFPTFIVPVSQPTFYTCSVQGSSIFPNESFCKPESSYYPVFRIRSKPISKTMAAVLSNLQFRGDSAFTELFCQSLRMAAGNRSVVPAAHNIAGRIIRSNMVQYVIHALFFRLISSAQGGFNEGLCHRGIPQVIKFDCRICQQQGCRLWHRITYPSDRGQDRRESFTVFAR